MKITCLVDNDARPGLDLRSEHGLSFLIGCERGRVLFDTGASGTVLLHNMEALGARPEDVNAVALSHSHPDHTGGLDAFLARRPGVPVYAHPDLFRPRFSEHDGRMLPRGLAMDAEALRRRAELHLSEKRQEVVPGVWTTGEIVERPKPEGRSPHHFVRDGEQLVPDPYRDDLSLVLESGEGLVLACGCCHAGLLNTLSHVQRSFGRAPVAVVGGTHLVSADEAHLRRLVEELERLGPPALYPNHCTGEAGYAVLAQAFGDQVAPCPAGTILEWSD